MTRCNRSLTSTSLADETTFRRPTGGAKADLAGTRRPASLQPNHGFFRVQTGHLREGPAAVDRDQGRQIGREDADSAQMVLPTAWGGGLSRTAAGGGGGLAASPQPTDYRNP